MLFKVQNRIKSLYMREPLKDNKSYEHALTDVKAWRISEFENVDALKV